MSDSGLKGIGAIAVRLTLQGGELARARAIIDRAAQLRDERVPDWDDAHAAIVVRDTTLAVASRVFALARAIRELLIEVDEGFQVGIDACTTDSERRTREMAEMLAERAQPKLVALSWPLFRALGQGEGDAVEQDGRGLLHFPASGTGVRVTALAPQLVASELERYVARDSEGHTDRDGLLRQPTANRALRRVGDLIRDRRALVLGEPWSGKSWVASQLADQLSVLPHVWFVSFEQASAELVRADQWQRWRLSSEPGYLIVDALDEGFYRDRDRRVVAARLSGLRELGDAEAARLHVLAFCRSSYERDALAALGWQGGGVSWHLQPLDEDELARQLSPGDEQKGKDGVANARHHICALGDPRLARDYVVLSRLAELGRARSLAAGEVEDLVLGELCDSQNARNRKVPLDVVTRIAAVLQFSGADSVDLTGEDHGMRLADGSPVRLGDMFFEADPVSLDLRREGRALVRSPLFGPARRGYRFRQHFAKERFAAAAIRFAPLHVIRELITGPRGGVLPSQRAVLDRIVAATQRPEIADMQREQPRPLGDDEAVKVLREMLAHPGARSWNLSSSSNLALLASTKVAERIATVLLDEHAMLSQKSLALDVARVNAAAPGWETVAPAALHAALDHEAEVGLREDAARLLCDPHFVGRLLRTQLQPIADDSSESTANLRAIVLYDLLDGGAPVLQVAARAPLAEPSFGDERSVLWYELNRRLSEDDARLVIDQKLGRAPATLSAESVSELFESACEKLAEAPAWSDEDVERIAAIVDKTLDGELNTHAFDQKIAANAVNRRRFFSTPNVPETSLLDPKEDASWSNQAAARQDALAAHNARRAQERHQRRLVQDVIAELLAAELTPEQSLWSLGQCLFVPRQLRPRDIIGSFEHLAPETAATVLRRLAAALIEAEPSVLPDTGSSYPARFGAEAAAFSAVVLRDAIRLSSTLVGRWLPLALFASYEPLGPLIAACFHCDSGATKNALLVSLRREVASPRVTSDVASFPGELLRDEAFVSAVLEIAAEQDDVAATERLLWALAGRVEEQRRRWLAELLARAPWRPTVRLSVLATQAYLRDGEGFETVLPGTDVASASFLTPVMTRWRELGWSVDASNWAPLPLAALAEWLVARFPRETVLRRPLVEFVAVTEETRLRELRDQAVHALILRAEDTALSVSDPHAELVLRRMCEQHPWIAARRSLVASARRIDRLLSALDALADRLPPREVARRFAANAPPALRTVDDLFHVLVERLQDVAEHVSQYANLIWRGRSETKGRKNQNEPRLQEFLQLRLNDYFAAQGRVRLIREPVEGHGDKADYAAVLLQSDDEGSIAIEAKWSHDRRWLEGLDVLAQHYLRDQHREHGIYVVGFTGEPPNKNLERMTVRLTAKADEIRKANPSYRIALVVLPIVREEKTKKAPQGSAPRKNLRKRPKSRRS